MLNYEKIYNMRDKKKKKKKKAYEATSGCAN